MKTAMKKPMAKKTQRSSSKKVGNKAMKAVMKTTTKNIQRQHEATVCVELLTTPTLVCVLSASIVKTFSQVPQSWLSNVWDKACRLLRAY